VNNRNKRRYAFHERYAMHLYDAEQPELPVVQQVQVIVGYTPKGEFFAPIVDRPHDESESEGCGPIKVTIE
jgi:hypothetical protein